jgi:hypothetical protein
MNVTGGTRGRNADATNRLPARVSLVALAGAIVLLASSSVSLARPYTVLSCDAAIFQGSSAEAWTPSGSVGRAYSSCPSGGGDTTGISNRITNVTVGRYAHSRHAFDAPYGTSITGFSWSGRFARNSCGWATALYAYPGTHYLFGLLGNQQCGITALDIRGQSIPWTVPAGTTRLEQLVWCDASQCGPGATFHTQWIAVTVDDPVPPSFWLGGSLVTQRWVRGEQELVVSASDNVGIARYSAALGGERRAESFLCNYARPRPCDDKWIGAVISTLALPQGANDLYVEVVDGAGNTAQAVHTVRVDNQPPERIRPSLDGGEGWRNQNLFRIRWSNPSQPYAPIVRARYRICHAGSCTYHHVDGVNVEELPPIALGEPGEHTVQLWLEDEAGNQSFDLSASDPVHLRLDQEAPRLAFEAPDPANPLRVAVSVEDRHSGLDSGEIEIRRRGGDGWHTLPTARDGERLVGHLDYERVVSGGYELRARARDRAGNEGSTDRRADGSVATIDVPVRVATRIRVGLPRVTRVRGRGRRRGRGRTRVRLLSQARVRHGRQLELRGWLRNVDGQPIGAATIEVEADSPGDAVGLVPVGFARTDLAGRFSYIVRADRSKLLRFRYPGSSRMQSAARDFVLHVPASTTMRARPRRLLNGETVRLSGRVTTRPVPSNGKLIEVQAFFRDRWRTFSTTRSDRRGRWRFDYRFGGTRGRVFYRLRARLPAEGGYPFDTGRSRSIRVLVVGL